MCWADGFAELAGDATFFAGRVAAQGVFAAEARGDGAFFEGVVDCVAVSNRSVFVVWMARLVWCGGGNLRWPEELLQHDVHPAHHLGEQEVVPGFVHDVRLVLVPAVGRGEAE